jgi:hypothetical protein
MLRAVLAGGTMDGQRALKVVLVLSVFFSHR